MKVSASIELLWQFAGQEAIAGEFDHIEPEHFFAAVLKLAELPVEDLGNFAPAENVARELTAEVNAIRQELDGRSIDSTRVRRALRARLGRGGVAYDGGQKHRSQASRDLFDAAARAADDANAETLTLRHLLQALLAKPTPAMQEVLDGAGRPSPPERSETPLMNDCGKDLVQMARADQLGKGIDRPAECKALLHLMTDTGRRSVVMVTDNDHTSLSIVVAAAHSIANAECPADSHGKRIVDVTSVVPDKDEAMQRLEEILAEAAIADDVILLVPPVEVSSDSDQMSPWAEMLKGALISGAAQWICRATPTAYERWIEKDRDWKQHVKVMWIKEAGTDSIPWEL